MMNAFGYYASAKGMVLVPDLSGLSSSAAIAALSASGLEYSLGSDVNTSTSSLDNLVASQSPSANTLVDYSTVVAFSLYNFVSSPPPPVDPPPPATTYYGTACCNGAQVQASGSSMQIVEDSIESQCGGPYGISNFNTTGFVTLDCTPAPPPPPACSGQSVYSVAGTSSSWGCPSGTANVTYWYDECDQLVDEVFVSCVAPPPPPPPPPPAGCSGPPPFPECSCVNGIYMC